MNEQSKAKTQEQSQDDMIEKLTIALEALAEINYLLSTNTKSAQKCKGLARMAIEQITGEFV
jgi:hypothetical protein